jgi:selenocysteine lyase/cysteine desulfurase
MQVRTRRDFLSLAGKGLGLAALSSATVASLLRNVEAVTKSVAHLTPEEAATDEDYWATIQNSFSVTRGIINLNNGGVSPSPRIVTEALVRYIWEQEDATAYTMWQILEPQSETIRTGLAELFGCKFEEIGTHSAAPKLAIGEALLFHSGIGGKRKEARLRYLSRYWMNRLKDAPKIRFNTSFDPNQSCAIANVQIEGTNPEAVTKYLFDKHHIFTVPIVHEEFQGIRITPNLYTTLSELDRFCEQMELIARKGLPA